MPIQENILNQMICCLNTDGHIVCEPILLKCGANACKQCVVESTNSSMKCFNCNENHEKNDVSNAPINKMVEYVIQLNLNDLFQNLKTRLEFTTSTLKETALIEEMQGKIESLEVEMEARVESLIRQINKHRDECRLQLKKCKEDFEKFVKKENLEVKKSKKKECEINENNVSYELFLEKQNELKVHQIQLQNYKETINRFQFIPSSFIFIKEQFGEISNGLQALKKLPWYKNSLILTVDEGLSLVQMSHLENASLLYRATRDGFSSSAFHLKCDGKQNTFVIIKNNFNYVFGGYTAAKWASDRSYCADSTAFIFSLRKNGISNATKFMIMDPNFAILNFAKYGPTFGNHDLFIGDGSDIKTGSFTNLGCSYELPHGYTTQNENTKSLLAGNFNNWLCTEIEVYQMFK